MYDDFGNYIGDASLGAFPGDSGFDTSGDVAIDSGSGFDTALGLPSIGNAMGLIPSPAKIVGGVVGNPGRIARAGAGVIMTAAGKMNMSKVWGIVKKFGLDVAAGALGWSAADLVTALVASGVPTRTRRRRGISWRDIRVTKRVCRFAHSLNATLAHCGTRHRRSR